MKRVISFVIALVAASTATAQTIIGKWSAPRLGLEMVLNPDYSYAFGPSTGRFQVQGTFIYFQDAASGVVTPYTVSLSGNRMEFRDVNGVPILFERVTGAPVPAIESGTGPVVASAGADTLRQGDVDASIDILQFIIDGRVTDEERKQLTEQTVREFETDPGVFLKDLETLAGSRARLGQLNDPLQVAGLRQALLVAFHKAARDRGTSELPLFMRIMNRYVQVVAFDETNQLALTDKDLAAFFDYSAFLHQLNTGREITWPASVRDSVKNDLAARFAVLPVADRRFYCGMAVIWNYFKHAWKTAAEAQRAQMARGMCGGNAAPGINYGGLTPGAAPVAPAGREMDDDTFRTLKDVMLRDHVDTMNAWSSIGDSPYYYEIVDY